MSVPTRIALAFIAAALVLAAMGAPGGAHNWTANGHHSLTVRTSDGEVRGRTGGTTTMFLGIPYAAPPVGQLRWHAPRPAAPWHGVRNATRFAPHCAQPASAFGKASMSENCLYLNVYTPDTDRSDLPVMVWLHGGALVYGESDDFNPAPLVAKGVIVVTVNYRLGALGFLADPALGAVSGNYGLMDQQAALRWVKTNIPRFGGSAGNVTLFGESAGGLSVLAQMTSPGARGLFKRAIAESGTYDMVQKPLVAADSDGVAFATSVGCTKRVAACLGKLPVRTILAHETLTGYRPDVDGIVLKQTIQAAFAGGTFARVPVILGTNRDEYRLLLAQAEAAGEPPVTAGDYFALISYTFKVPPAGVGAIAAQYPLKAYVKPALALGAATTDALFACPALAADEALSSRTPTFAYEFADEHAPQRYLPSRGFPYGATHTAEIPYLFDLTAPLNGGLDTAQRRLSADMVTYWTSFARLGRPSSLGKTLWASFSTAHQSMLSLNTPSPTRRSDFANEHHCGFWNSAP